MADTPSRIIGLAGVLLGAWALTYWLYTPMHRTHVTMDGPIPSSPAPVVAHAPPVAPPAAPPSDLQPSPPVRTRKVQKLVPPEMHEYRVQKGDTGFDRIAARAEVYGNRKFGDAVARANPWASPDKLKPGVTVLKIPVDPDNIQGKLVWVDEPMPDDPGASAASDSPTQVSPIARPALAASDAATKTYTIQKDDTLSDISKRFYGRSGLWKAIADANKDVIPNPDRLPSGATIKIPPAPSSN